MGQEDKLNSAYGAWKDRPTPESMASALDAAEPVISSALTSYAGSNQALHAQAKKLAARGIESYDPDRGAKLRSHLMNQMQPLRRLNQQRSNVIRVPERVQLDLYKLRQTQQDYFDKYSREAADTELAEQMGISVPRIRHLRKFMRTTMPESGFRSMEEGDSEIFYPGVTQASPEDVWLEYIHHDSSPVDQKILEWKTGYNGKQIITTQEIAKRLGLSPSAVSQRASRMARRISELQEAKA
jgi:DNA-directed RNA polymerase specialized sigma subunit